MSAPVLNAANQLTLLRMALAPLLVVLVLGGEMVWALTALVVAGITDMLDGLIARRGHRQTTLGAMLDPMADKLLLTSAYVVLTWSSKLLVAIPAWLTVITLSRDAIIVVSVAIINLTIGRRIFYPTLLGKCSTVAQLLTVGLVLLLNVLETRFPPVIHLFQLSLFLTVASALHYVYLASTKGGAPPAP